MTEEKQSTAHSLIMENRKNLTLTGVRDVESFDDETVVMITSMGQLTVKGASLHISGFNRDTGDLSMDGAIYAVAYTDDRKNGGSVWSRIFK